MGDEGAFVGAATLPRNGAPVAPGRPAARSPPAFWVQGSAAALVATLFVLWVRNQWGGPWATTVFSDVASTLVPLGAAWACFDRSRRGSADLRTAWRLMGGAAFAWALGQAAWTAIEFQTHAPPPTPSIADVGYLLFIPLAAWGTARFVRSEGQPTGYVRAILDGAIVGSSFIAIAFVFGLESILLGSDKGNPALIINLLYPFGDALILGIALLRVSRAPRAALPALGLLSGGLVFLALADLWFLVVNAEGTYDTGGLLDAFWVLGFLLIGLAAGRPGNLEHALPPPKQTIGLALLPLFPFLLAAAAVCFAEVRDGGVLSDTLFWTFLVVVLLVFFRLIVMVVDNLVLTRREGAARQALEAERGMRTQMMNAITHDMLNAMSPIRIQLQLLGEGSFGRTNAKQAHSLAMVSRNAEQMARLANDIKEAANVEEGRLVVIPTAIDLARTAADAVATRQAEAEQRGVDLVLHAPTAVPMSGDAGRLTQVLDNLLSNALKFTPKDGHVAVDVVAKPGAVEVRVADSGHGLEPAQIEMLFKPYSQVHDPQAIKEKGTGLGLYISKGIVERHGGRIWVESAGLNRGSTFIFTLPFARPVPPS